MRRATTTTTPATTSVSVPSRGAAAKRAGSNRSLATSAVKAAVGIYEMPSLTVRGRARLVLREAVHVDAEGLVGDRRREDQRGQEALLCEARRERGGIEDLAGVHERDRGGDGHRGRAGQGHARQHELPRARIVRGGEEERHERAEARHRLHDATGDPDGEVGQHDRTRLWSCPCGPPGPSWGTSSSARTQLISSTSRLRPQELAAEAACSPTQIA